MSATFDPAPLVAAVRAGDKAAFMRLVEVYGFMVRSYVGSQVYNGADIDDLAQETFIAAYRVLADFRLGDDFGAWLRGIARNRIRMHFRSRHRRLAALDRFREEVAVVVETELDREDEQSRRTREALLGCVAKLPEKLRRIVHAGLEGARAAQLAQDFRTTPGAIYQLHYRANQLLRACLQREVRNHE
jgi:RNA polymerase sigma-70 factor (ECF subfamily)